IRAAMERKSRAREATLSLSRGIIRTSANAIRAAHRGEIEGTVELLAEAAASIARMREQLVEHPDIYGAGYVHDCQKEFAEAAIFVALVSGRDLPGPDDLKVEPAAYLNGIGEAVGELRRHTLDRMRHGDLERAECVLSTMDDIYYSLVTFDYPDGLTGGLRRTTDSVRGIIEKPRGELTTALRQQQLRDCLDRALAAMGERGSHGG